jgi:alkaline phosphatase D
MVQISRRTALFAGVGGGVVPGALGVSGFVRPQTSRRIELPVGVRSGDVTTDSAVLWSAGSSAGELRVRLTSNGRRLRSVRGAYADEQTDFTARHTLRGLAPGREYEATLWFEDSAGRKGEEQTLRFSTAPIHPAPTSLVWSGDVCGQGWGINDELGGMTSYQAMLDVQPDLFLHCGDTIYADEPIEARVLEPDLTHLWRSRVELGVDHVAETLADFRGRHRYNLLDDNVRRFHQSVPMVAQWDDHETTNNWWPGHTVADPAYRREKSCDVLAARSRRAWQEYQPIALDHLNGRGTTGFAEALIYRKVSRGAHLDVFCLDQRSYRGPNDVPEGQAEKGLMGEAQTEWLIREVSKSRATWKVISADQPLSINARLHDDRDSYANHLDGTPKGREAELARVLSAFKANGVRNVVWVTADVHYTAAHHYDPSRAAYTDFDPFWEFVSGPLHGSTFPAKDVDTTFGAKIHYALGAETLNPKGESPRAGKQFFGQMLISRDGALTVNLRKVSGEVLWTKVLEPAAL